MSVYTTQVLVLIKELTPQLYNKSIKERMEVARPLIFDFNYPIWDEEYKPILERKILMHYLQYEIGLETPALWKLYLEEKLNEIMPYYTEVYNSIYPYVEKLYKNYDFTETHNDERNSVGERTFGETTNTKGTDNIITNETIDRDTTDKLITDSTTNTTNHNLRIESDLPQTTLNNLDYATKSISDNGGSDVTFHEDKDDKGTEDVTRNVTTDDTFNTDGKTDNKTDTTNLTTYEYTLTKLGLQNVPYSELIDEHIKNIQNIDVRIIKDLKPLFMTIF